MKDINKYFIMVLIIINLVTVALFSIEGGNLLNLLVYFNGFIILIYALMKYHFIIPFALIAFGMLWIYTGLTTGDLSSALFMIALSLLPIGLGLILLIHHSLPTFLVKIGKKSLALQHYDNLIRWIPKSPGVYIQRADLYIQERDYQKALDDYQSALALTKANSQKLSSRSKDMIDNHSNQKTLHHNIAVIYLSTGNYHLIPAQMETALQLAYLWKKDRRELLAMQAKAYLYAQKPAEALEVFKQIDIDLVDISQYPEDWKDILFNFVLTYHALGQHSEADKLWRKLPKGYSPFDNQAPAHIQALTKAFIEVIS